MRCAVWVLFLSLSLSVSASTYVVDNIGDTPDASPGDNDCLNADGRCTLRAAIEEANATPGTDTIRFSIAGTINVTSDLPPVTGRVTIDGATAPGYTTVPRVIVDGGATAARGFHFDTGSALSQLLALQVSGFTDAGVIVDADTITIQRNYLGPVLSGNPNGDGLWLGGNGSTLGGADGEGNVLSGNDICGLLISGTNHIVRDNFIGTDPTGLVALPNGDAGIEVVATAGPLTIGSPTSGEENVISGNTLDGILFGDASGVIIAGNFIGVDVTGAVALGNGWAGIYVSSDGITVGTTTRGNVISGNADEGILIEGSNTIVQNNLIGTDVTGTLGISNGLDGVAALLVENVDIGGSGANEGNVISFNSEAGIFGVEMDLSRVTGNIIGLDESGAVALGNGFEGIVLADSIDTTVASNIISGNGAGGIVDGFGFENTFEENYIGTIADGSAAVGNLGTGIEAFGSFDAIIRSNVIAANDGHGIETTFGAIGSVIHSNIVGLSADQSTPLGNTVDGINVCDGSQDTIVGSELLGGNIVSANLENGIGVEPTALTNNTWAANSIYENVLLGIDIGIDGVTANDPDDPDTGANNYQNFPVLTSAVTEQTSSTVTGTIDTLPDTPFTIHFYTSPASEADPSGYGEGHTYAGSVSGTTDANGDASFTFNGPALNSGDIVTATATTTDGTSEFSAPAQLTSASVQFAGVSFSIVEGTVLATVTVTRTGDLSMASTVQYATSDGTATNGSDYNGASGTLTFVPGDAEETFTFQVLDDVVDEADETVILTLSNPIGAILGDPSTAPFIIEDNDAAPTVTIDDPSAAEGSPLTFTLTLSNPSSSDVTVTYSTADGTATAADYTAQSSTATITAGNLSTTISVPTTADGTSEPDETLVVNLTGATNATITDNQGTGTILDGSQPSVTIDDPSATEGSSLTFTLTLSGPSSSDVTINYATADGTATAADYTAQSNTATITAGNLSTTITIATTPDATPEANETLFVNLTGATNAVIADNQGTGTINDDDTSADLTITKVANTPTFTAGQQIAYTITVQNLGPADANTITVTDVIPAGTTFVSATGASCSGTTTITCTIPTLANGASAVITLTLTANASTPITNTATVAAAAPADPTPLNNAAAAVVTPAATGIDEVPTLSEWALIALALALGVIAMRRT